MAEIKPEILFPKERIAKGQGARRADLPGLRWAETPHRRHPQRGLHLHGRPDPGDKFPCRIDFVRLASYGAASQSSGEIRITKDLETPIEGCDVLIVEDIVDTG